MAHVLCFTHGGGTQLPAPFSSLHHVGVVHPVCSFFHGGAARPFFRFSIMTVRAPFRSIHHDRATRPFCTFHRGGAVHPFCCILKDGAARPSTSLPARIPQVRSHFFVLIRWCSISHLFQQVGAPAPLLFCFASLGKGGTSTSFDSDGAAPVFIRFTTSG